MSHPASEICRPLDMVDSRDGAGPIRHCFGTSKKHGSPLSAVHRGEQPLSACVRVGDGHGYLAYRGMTHTVLQMYRTITRPCKDLQSTFWCGIGGHAASISRISRMQLRCPQVWAVSSADAGEYTTPVSGVATVQGRARASVIDKPEQPAGLPPWSQSGSVISSYWKECSRTILQCHLPRRETTTPTSCTIDVHQVSEPRRPSNRM